MVANLNFWKYWKYLIEIAKQGGYYGEIELKTAKLGDLVGVSQQTASRKLLYLEKKGLITRKNLNGGKVSSINLTEKGIMELRLLFSELKSIISDLAEELELRGKVQSGIGEGKYYVDKYSEYFKKNLDFDPFKGTLNVKLLGESDILSRNQIELHGGKLMKGFTKEERSFGEVLAFLVDVSKVGNDENHYPAYFLKIERTHYDSSIVELVSEYNLREKLNLEDDDYVRIIYSKSKNGN